jgi:hypothetical protein
MRPNRHLNGCANQTDSQPPSQWSWAFGKSEKIVRVYPVRHRLEVFVSVGGVRDNHVNGVSADVDVEFPVASLDPLDCFRFRNLPSRTAIVEAADVENAFVSVLSVALVDALDTFARSHRFSPLESSSADCAAVADPQVVSTLRRKRDEIEFAIVTYRAKIQDAERGLCAVTATLRLFELSGEAQEFCKSALGPNADRRRKYLNILALAGSFPALVHTVAAKAPAEPTKQEYDEDNDEYESDRHERAPDVMDDPTSRHRIR